MFQMTLEPIPTEPRVEVGAGAVVTFDGRVRNMNDGREVVSLEYDAYAELAEKEGESILQEAMRRFGLMEASCVHRTGHLHLGEVAIRVRAVAGHRREAFDACRWILDEVKRRVPIWKKEHYADGESDWLIGESVAPAPSEYYDRQVRMPGFGPEAQQRLAEASVLMVGAGGLGCAALPYLAGAGIGRITVLDDDRVALDNLHRQILFEAGQVGRSKAVIAAERLAKQNPLIRVEAVEGRLTAANALDYVAGFDLVIDGTDNFRTKFALNDACVSAGVPLLVASVHGFEGEIMLVDPNGLGGCLQCLWPDPPEDGCVGTCAEVGILGVVPGVLGLLQATEAIKWLTGLGHTLGEGLLLVDLLEVSTRRLARAKRPECSVCGSGKSPAVQWTIEWHERGVRMLIDVRDPAEIALQPCPEADVALPYDSFLARLDELPVADGYALVCRSGTRTEHLARVLHQQGRTEFVSIAGGLRARPSGDQVSTNGLPGRL